METVGYFAAGLIGISLGMIGGGGSILTVPVLVYLFKIEPTLATSYSLFIVGSTSLVGAISKYRENNVQVKTSLLFGMSSITTVFVTRKFIIPLIPIIIIHTSKWQVSQSLVTMVLFAILMLLASVSMIRSQSRQLNNEIQNQRYKIPVLLMYGIGIGMVTGLLGAGGGFLLIPVLVILVGLPMKKAIGTSLLIIALNSTIGFTGDLGHFNIQWLFLLKITAIAVAGLLLGVSFSQKMDGNQLKKGFGWFVLCMSVYIIVREILF